ncbi:probable inactive ATP-dependent zinc metalloprotease FTSHI 1, chloroplastic isoform X1 [Cryptomeria japonica]|uniref:probable inactive ATP-dependent zinc metalloprotease FTSHI 1, chloroplastic isoform X1 n=2 Tax=Cryptomeria japonica TaxID=3369 RepID=UPI0027DA4565|nr:probable inactive ATP-dependent zinc metalloprotease FTSHI 1, chloroplastic isoform X1 [Cryptomeria japonica]
MMVAGSMHSLELRYMSFKEGVPQPNLKGLYIHGRQCYRGSVQFKHELSVRNNIGNVYNNCSFYVRREGFCKMYTQIPKKISPFCTVSSSLPPRGKSNIRSGNKSEDYISRLLRERPSLAEPKFLKGDKIYTQSEIEEKKNWFGKRFSTALNEIFSKLASKEIKDTQIKEEEQRGIGEDTDKEAPLRAVYLKDLLRQYKGRLYVPEEAFDFQTSEIDEFNSNLKTLPEMRFDEFCKLMKANQIGMLTSRASPNIDGSYGYHDFIVDLKEIPAALRLQKTTWAMHLSDWEAQAILGQYSGPQREVARILTPYVVPPPAMPHPVGSSISSRLMVELTMLTSVITAFAFAAGGLLSAMVYSVTSLVAVLSIYTILPLVISVVVFVASILGRVLQTPLYILFLGLKRLFAVVSYIFTSDFKSMMQTAGIMIFVVAAMTAIIRFTLIRRPRDMKNWDIWTALEFAQSKPQARVEGTTGVMFKDVAGIDNAVLELQELVNYLKNPELFNKMGTKPPHGVLLEGPPGCGKTLLAKAIAGEAGVPFYEMAGSEFTEILVGVGAARVRDLFKRAKINKPSVVFVDEIDALGASRQGHDEDRAKDHYDASVMERDTTLNQLLIELDGFDTGKGVIFMAATNRKDLLDPALLRPGRFDRKIRVLPPGPKGRLDILKVHSRKVKMSPSVDLSVYAEILQGWTGARLAQLLQEAAMMSIRHGHDSIVQYDMDMAVDRLTVGPERRVKMAYPIRRAAAEVGLALTSHLLRRLDNANVEYCIRISMVPRDTLSRTIFTRFEDNELYVYERRPQLLHRLQVLLGGRAAEEVMYGRDISTLSLEYLPDASWLARKIISVWNLETTMTVHAEGTPWARASDITGPQIEFEGSLYSDYYFHEESLNHNLDDDINYRAVKLLNDMYKRTVTLIKHHHAALAKAIYVLVEKREISGNDLDLIIDLYPADTPFHLVEGEDSPGSFPPKVGIQQLPMEVSDAMWEKTVQQDKISSKTSI